MLQIDAGTLSLDDHLSEYVSGVPKGDVITIANLMSMRSGVYEFMSDFFGWTWPYLFTPTAAYPESKALSLIKGGASQFEPGSKFVYTNSNAILLGAVLRAITGRDIYTIMMEDIIGPLGLTETKWPGWPGASSADVPSPNLANYRINPEMVGAAGGLTTSVRDLTKFAKALRDGTLLSPATHEMWKTTFVTQEPLGGLSSLPAFAGYGYFMMQYGAWVGHGGSMPGGNGYTAACLYEPQTGATITVAENKQTASAATFYVIARAIGQALYPGSLVPGYMTPQDVALAGADSPRAFGPMEVFRYVPPGDADGKTDIPLKVPFAI